MILNLHTLIKVQPLYCVAWQVPDQAVVNVSLTNLASQNSPLLLPLFLLLTDESLSCVKVSRYDLLPDFQPFTSGLNSNSTHFEREQYTLSQGKIHLLMPLRLLLFSMWGSSRIVFFNIWSLSKNLKFFFFPAFFFLTGNIIYIYCVQHWLFFLQPFNMPKYLRS